MKLSQTEGVEPPVISRILRTSRRSAGAWLLLGLVLFSLVAPLRADPPKDGAKPAAAATPSKTAPAPAKPELDELAYNDGDRVRGHFLKREGNVIVFKSERFGLLRVPAAPASVTLAKPATPPASAPTPPKEPKPEGWAWLFSPTAFAKSLKEFFGAWHGKFAVSSEVLTDTAEHKSATALLQLDRKWKTDEVKFNARYDFVETNGTATTDTVKADATYRHDFASRLFLIYQPSLEWNRDFFTTDPVPLPADYVLLQQAAGAGINFYDQPDRKLRVGLAEDVFSVWTTPPQTRSQNTHTAEALFVEGEMKLPWRVSITERGTFYYSIARQTEGWENRFEIDKKLTETLTMGLQHEVRLNNPGLRVADYRRLKLLFGFDF